MTNMHRVWHTFLLAKILRQELVGNFADNKKIAYFRAYVSTTLFGVDPARSSVPYFFVSGPGNKCEEPKSRLLDGKSGD